MYKMSSIMTKHYIDALTEEKKKIKMFQRELPLCLELVNQAIENCRRSFYMGGRGGGSEYCEEGEEDMSNEEGPVLEEFIPMKLGATSSDEVEQEERVSGKVEEGLGNKEDWLRSAQLWNQTQELSLKQDHDLSVVGIKNLLKEKPTTATTIRSISPPLPPQLPLTPVIVAKASTSSTCDSSSRKRLEEREREIANNRKARRCWSPELHRRFLQALQELGGSHAATPKQIRELMKVDGLTNDEVKSHLQKYRLHTRRPSPAIVAPNNGNPQATQFVVVGGLWVPPQDHTNGESTTSNATKKNTATTHRGIYVPVPMRPQPQLTMTSPTYSLHSQDTSKGDHSVVVGDLSNWNRNCSSSPASSSSTRTTTASPVF